MKKKQMRLQIKEQLSALEKTEYEQRCHLIAAQLYALPEWQRAEVIAVTVSAPYEIDTWSIIRYAWLSGKKVCVPKCAPETKEMHFYILSDFRELEKVYAGLYEPSPHMTAFISPNLINFVLVPGLLFDENGYRIGFGGGYYDRFLTAFRGTTISLAFSFQLCHEVPVEPHDVPVQKIVTEMGVINCAK
ncbi:5-formyltetrahydrofolate cyclo-ligase [Domibacillus antri]|nr:5-formyltetrahydrofolate cyclo-ligase [Domibacillus antri]